MPVGNDVVDLGAAEIASKHEEARYVARVCAESECVRLESASDPKRLFWTLFAAKEAAYKLVMKLGPLAPLAHREFVVSADLTGVRYRDTTVALAFEQGAEYVHAVATSGRGRVISSVHAIASGENASMSARHRLIRAVAPALGTGADELEVVRAPRPGSWDGFGPPELFRRGMRLERVDVSLSHDARFVAFAAMVIQASAQAGPSVATA